MTYGKVHRQAGLPARSPADQSSLKRSSDLYRLPAAPAGKSGARELSGGSVGQVSGGTRCPPWFERRRAPHLFLKRSGSAPGSLQKKKMAKDTVLGAIFSFLY